MLVFIQHWHWIDTIQPNWRHSHYAGLAFLLFLTAWLLREKLAELANGAILFLSELTYSVYLFHTWLFERIKQLPLAGGIFQHNIYALILLFLTCAILVKLIEKPGIKAGRKLVKFMETHRQMAISFLKTNVNSLRKLTSN